MKEAEEELRQAAERIANSIDETRLAGRRHLAMHVDEADLLRQLLQGMAAHWALRPVADLDAYLMSPSCKLARHILGRTT